MGWWGRREGGTSALAEGADVVLQTRHLRLLELTRSGAGAKGGRNPWSPIRCGGNTRGFFDKGNLSRCLWRLVLEVGVVADSLHGGMGARPDGGQFFLVAALESLVPPDWARGGTTVLRGGGWMSLWSLIHSESLSQY